MEANWTKLAMRAFQFANDLHIVVGSGIAGVLVHIYKEINHQINFETFHIFAVGSLTAACLFYSFSSRETVSVISEKLIFITECDSGLGFSQAQHACEVGFTVLAGCMNLQAVGASILEKKYNKKIVLVQLDLTDEDSISNAVDQVELFLSVNERCELWAVVNNAEIMVFGEFEWLTDRLIREQLDINILGTLLVTKSFLPLLRKYSALQIFKQSIHLLRNKLEEGNWARTELGVPLLSEDRELKPSENKYDSPQPLMNSSPPSSYHSIVYVDDHQVAFSRTDSFQEATRSGFQYIDDSIRSLIDYDEDKYLYFYRSAAELMKRWWKNMNERQTRNRVSGDLYKPYCMAAILLIGTLIVLFIKSQL